MAELIVRNLDDDVGDKLGSRIAARFKDCGLESGEFAEQKGQLPRQPELTP